MKEKTPIISIVGRSNSGKTTLAVKLVRELKQRGYRVATIKHSHHALELDTEGKDSWLYSKAGADTVIVVSPTTMGVIRQTPQEMPLSKIMDTYIADMDVVLIEGYKAEAIPKMEVFRTDVSDELVCQGDKNLLAVIGDKKPEIDVPFFHMQDNVSAIVDFLVVFIGSSTQK
ncbi:MAG TPA: molybdopterin-guanine dinucleotide biosynthesis protein B [Candidatus Brocadiaceae bacterium]|nr:molybdopterin-guanine dinucleotide biosynthesis protein B [Candidatus Brocadiaceae bacterium]